MSTFMMKVERSLDLEGPKKVEEDLTRVMGDPHLVKLSKSPTTGEVTGFESTDLGDEIYTLSKYVDELGEP